MRPIVSRYAGALPAGKYTAVPGIPDFGGGVTVDPDATGDLTSNTVEQSYLFPPIHLGNRNNPNGTITGIGIAADSPISEVDLWSGDVSARARIRVGVGRPWFGDLGEVDTLNVTYPRSIPKPTLFVASTDANGGETTVQWAARNQVWDSVYAPNTANLNQIGDFTFPVRLELYRGSFDYQIPTRRSPYCLDATYALKASPYARFWMITDGRAIVDVTVVAQINGADYTSPLNPATVIVRSHDPALPCKSADALLRYPASFVLDTTVIGGVATAPVNFPCYKQSFVVPAQLYSVTIINSDQSAGAGHGVTGSVSIVARDA